jgi:hypothetical protein
MEILLDLNAKVGREDIFKLTIGNESFLYVIRKLFEIAADVILFL